MTERAALRVTSEVHFLEFKPSKAILNWTDVLLNGSIIGWVEKHDGRKHFQMRSSRRVLTASLMNQIVKELES